MRRKLLGFAIIAAMSLTACTSSPPASDLAGVVQARVALCKFDAQTAGLNFNHASVIPNDQIPLGNTGEHPGAEWHYLKVPVESYAAQPDDTSAVGFDMTNDPKTGWMISSGPPFWPSQCNGTDDDVRKMLISDPLQQ